MQKYIVVVFRNTIKFAQKHIQYKLKMLLRAYV